MTQNQIRGLERAHWTDTAESVTETNPVDHVFESRTRPQCGHTHIHVVKGSTSNTLF